MPDAIPVEDLAESLRQVVKELTHSFCLSKQDGIEVSIMDEKVEVQLSVIAPAGLNSITRRTTTTTGEEKTITNIGKKVSTSTEESWTQSSEAAAFTSVSTTTKKDPETTTTRKNPIKSSTTVQESEPDVTVTDETQSSIQDSERTGFGGDNNERRTTYDGV
jgi:hypothetical protein